MTTTTPYTGQSILRFEDDRLLRGDGEFIADMTLPGMAHVSVVRSPHAHASIERIDGSAALAMPGVLAIITGDDVEDGAVLESVGRPGMQVNRGGAHPILALGRALYAGQPVAAVAAETAAQAADAVSRVEVVYEPLEAVNDLQRAAEGGYATLHQAIGSNVGGVAAHGRGRRRRGVRRGGPRRRGIVRYPPAGADADGRPRLHRQLRR